MRQPGLNVHADAESGKLDEYSPLEAKYDSKGSSLTSPLRPYMIQAPLAPTSGTPLQMAHLMNLCWTSSVRKKPTSM